MAISTVVLDRSGAPAHVPHELKWLQQLTLSSFLLRIFHTCIEPVVRTQVSTLDLELVGASAGWADTATIRTPKLSMPLPPHVTFCTQSIEVRPFLSDWRGTFARRPRAACAARV